MENEEGLIFQTVVGGFCQPLTFYCVTRNFKTS